jgi:hypothetical protein
MSGNSRSAVEVCSLQFEVLLNEAGMATGANGERESPFHRCTHALGNGGDLWVKFSSEGLSRD